jgi:RecA-family ATPase
MSIQQTATEAARINQMFKQMPKTPTSGEILSMDFPDIHWVVPGFITTGLTILAGAPKMGKSWLMLNMGYALSVGGSVFGKIMVQPTEVLYLALEDTERRLKQRLNIIEARPSSLLYMPTEWPRGDAAVKFLELWMVDHPDTRAVFIDTLQKISGVEDQNSYTETYNSAAVLKRFADKYAVAVVVVHHTRKIAADDFLHSVSGSVGLTGAADTIITLTRGRGETEGILSITGRDVEEKQHGITFDPFLGTWKLMDYVPKKAAYFGVGTK